MNSLTLKPRFKHLFMLSVALTTLSSVTWLAQVSHAELCSGAASVFSNSSLPKEVDWRKDATHLQPGDGTLAKTDANREQEMEKLSKYMIDEITGQGKFAGHSDIPPIEFIPESGVKVKVIEHADDPAPNVEQTKLMFSGLGKDGIVKGTFLAPVSGHTGVANAKAWSKTDTFNVTVDTSSDAAGTQFISAYGESAPAIVKNVKSLDLITYQEMEIKLTKDRLVRIYYNRSGSTGPAGYFDGRVIDLFWDGT